MIKTMPIKNNGYAIEFVDKALRKDKEIVLEAVKNDGNAIEFADKALKKDPDILKILESSE